MQRRAKECWDKKEGTESEFEQLLRGWFLGREQFRKKLETLAAKVVKDRKRESYSSSALRRHDEVQAARLLEAGLRKLGLTQEEARHLRQNDLRKQGLMCLVKSRTVVQDAWLQGELDTRDRSNISRAVAAYRKASAPLGRLAHAVFSHAIAVNVRFCTLTPVSRSDPGLTLSFFP